MLLTSVLVLASATMIAGDIPESADVGNTPLSETSDPTVRPDLENARDNADSANLAKPPFPTGNPGNWINSGDYPLTSLRIRRGGTVGFRLEIDQNGKVKDCTVTQSSGAVDLDAAACIKIFIRAKFEPARDAAGSATIGYWSSRIRWELPNAGFGALIPAGDETNDYPRPPKRFAAGEVPISKSDFPRAALSEGRGGKSSLSLQINAEGRVSGCTVTASSGHADLDDKGCTLAIRNGYFEPAVDIDGKATAGKIAQFVDWHAGPAKGSATPNAGANDANIGKRGDLRERLDFNPQSNLTFKIAYDVDTQGVSSNCKLEQVIDDSNRPISQEQRDLCTNVNGRRAVPYRDVAGNPVARRVSVTTEFRIVPVAAAE